MNDAIGDLRDACRSLRRARRFTLALVTALTLAVGAGLPLYSAADALLFRPPRGVPAVSRLADIYTSRFTGATYGPSSYSDFADVAATVRAFAGVAAYREGGPVGSVQLAGAHRAFQYAEVSQGFFDVLGVEPHAGSLALTGSEAARPPAIVSFEFAAENGGRATVGSALKLNGTEYTVIGIAPAGFGGLHIGSSPQVWIPLNLRARRTDRGDRTLQLIGRLRGGVSRRDAQHELNALAEALAAHHPDTNRGSQNDSAEARRFTLAAYSRLESAANPQATLMAAILLAATVLVVLSGCVNAAALFLARGIGRRAEFALRAALGANRRRLARLVLSESLVLSLAGAVCGLMVSLWLSAALRGLLSTEESAVVDFRQTWSTSLAIVGIPVLVGAVVGSVSAVSATRLRLPGSLQVHGAVADPQGGPLRMFVLGAQVMMATILLVGAALLTRGLAHAARADYLFAAEEAALVTVQGSREYQNQALDRLRRMDGVIGAGATTNLPLARGARREFRVSHGEREGSEVVEAAINFVSVGYFPAMSVPVVAGRSFNRRDDHLDEHNIVVNEAFAYRYLGRTALERELEDPRGTRLRVVGVVRNQIHRTLQGPPEPMVYYPAVRSTAPGVHLVIRARGDAERQLATYVRELGAISGGRVESATQFAAHIQNVLLQERVAMWLVGACGLNALFLTVLGVYAVATQEVRRRTRELALRLALGATRLQAGARLSRTASVPIAAGASLGLCAVLLILRAVHWLAFVPSVEATTILAAIVLVVTVTLAAAVLPLWRAFNTSPWVALRSE